MKSLKFFFYIFLLSVCFPSSAQVQHGYVKTRGRLAAGGTVIAGKRLNGATIYIKGKGKVVSHNNGKANGAFSFNVPGKTFCLTNVQKNGYQLCDRDLIGNPFQHSANDLIVVMDTPENALQDKLTSEKKIRRTLQRQLQEKEDELEDLKEQQKISLEEYRKQLQELYAAQENNEKLIADMAERYSTLDFDQLDEFQRRVAAFIQNGELTRADSLLNTKGSMEKRKAKLEQSRAVIDANAKDIERRQKEQEDAIALQKKELNDFAADCYSRYEICKMQHKNDSAAYWLELRASMDTLNVDWQLSAGLFISDFLADYDKALCCYQASLNAAINQYGENSITVAACYNNIGNVYHHKGFNEQASDCLHKALKINMEELGEKYPAIATIYNNLGNVYDGLGDIDKALKYYQNALKIRLDIWGEEHLDVTSTYNNIGNIYYKQSQYQIALEYYQKGLKTSQTVLGEKHPVIATIYNNLGNVYNALRDFDKALEYYLHSFSIRLEILGEEHPDLASTYNNIGTNYYKLGKYLTALGGYQKALSIYMKTFGKQHANVALCYQNIGLVHCSLHNFDVALDFLQKALRIYQFIWGDRHSTVAKSYKCIGCTYIYQKKYSDALNYFQKALDIYHEIAGTEDPQTETIQDMINMINKLLNTNE